MKYAGASEVRHAAADWITRKHQATGNEDMPARNIEQIQSTILPTLQLALFPYFIPIAGRSIHLHTFFESLGYAVAFAIFLILRSRSNDSLSYPLRWATLAAAFVGGTLGSKLLYWLEDPQLTLQHLHDPAYLLGGKTIVGALLGGLFAVEAMKRYIGLHQSTGDLFAIPVAVGLAIGRIGCFLTGLSDNTYGTPTSLPWGVDFGDGIDRHPTQLYEIVFLLALIALLARIRMTSTLARPIGPDEPESARTGGHDFSRAESPSKLIAASAAGGSRIIVRPGDAFKLFMTSYLAFRLFCDFIKPYPSIGLGLGAIQWACVLGLLYYSRDLLRWARLLPDGVS